MRAVVEQGIGDQIFVPDEYPSALWAANGFASAESDEVVTHVGVIPEMRNRRRVSGRVVHARNVVLLGELGPLVHFDLSGGVREVSEVHHRSTFVDGFLQIVARFDLDQLHARGTQLMIEWVAVRFLDNDFRLQASEVRQLLDVGFIVSGENAC